MKIKYKIIVFGMLILSLGACRKFIDVPPPTTQIVTSAVYSSNATAASALNAIYLNMASGYPNPGGTLGGGAEGISAILGLSSDEFTLYPTFDPVLGQAYTNDQLASNSPREWSDLYNIIYQANTAILGITSSTGVTPAMKQQLTGEAEFIRAYCYFYLVNIYGDVPLILASDYKTNSIASRTPAPAVYRQIVTDLKDAQNRLGDDFLTPTGAVTTERVRPNKIAATAMLARVYLYTDSLAQASNESTTVITNGNYQLLTNLDSVFLANSNEAIWQLEEPNNEYNTPDGQVFLMDYSGGPTVYNPFILSNVLLSSFDTNDRRLVHWVGNIIVNGTTYYFAHKYKLNFTGQPPIEYPMMLRFAEQYLIRAEAKAGLGDLPGAVADLNVIRARAGLAPFASSSQQNILAAILTERRHELFTENGHRWLDLKRTGTVDAVMSVVTPQKGGNWKPTDALYPIPLSDIKTDPNLKQNPGY